jgi:hypothetical protein
MGLPSPGSLSLSQAAAFVMKRCSCSEREAEQALQQAGLDSRLDAAGTIPLSAHPNPKIRETHRARKRQTLRPDDWTGQIDWDTGKVGPYFSVSITRLSLEGWLNAGGEVPSAQETSGDKLRTASVAIIKETIRAVYGDAERAGQKAPNVKEVVKPVQAKLRGNGLKASGRHIQEEAEAEEFKERRRKPGPTLASERRRQD